MALKLGVIGLGHWFNRLHHGMEQKGGLILQKAVGTRPYDDKAAELRGFGITKENYYTVRANTFDPAPSAFFNDLDVVQIANPNRYHAIHTKQSLGAGKCTVTEKTFGVTREEFYDVLDFIQKNKVENKAYLHLHYVHKLPLMEFKKLLPGLVAEQGKITSFSGTFFEAADEKDMHRKWLFTPENGGVFMDWIHPFEIMIYGAEAAFGGFEDLRLYTVNSTYDSTNPTGVGALVRMHGRYLKGNIVGAIRVGKGVNNESAKKEARLVFESGAYLTLRFASSESEFYSDDRGSMELVKETPLRKEFLFTKNPKGPNTSEFLIDEIMSLYNGKRTILSMDQIKEIFEAQWEYQKLVASKSVAMGESDLKAFIKSGVEASLA